MSLEDDHSSNSSYPSVGWCDLCDTEGIKGNECTNCPDGTITADGIKWMRQLSVGSDVAEDGSDDSEEFHVDTTQEARSTTSDNTRYYDVFEEIVDFPDVAEKIGGPISEDITQEARSKTSDDPRYFGRCEQFGTDGSSDQRCPNRPESMMEAKHGCGWCERCNTDGIVGQKGPNCPDGIIDDGYGTGDRIFNKTNRG